MNRGQEIQEVCRIISIRDKNIREAETKGAFERTPALKSLLAQGDAAEGERIKIQQITEEEVIEAYGKRADARLSDQEIRIVYRDLVKAARADR